MCRVVFSAGIIGGFLTGCNHPEKGVGGLGWSPINPDADSITKRIDRMFFLHSPKEEIKIRIDSLREMTKERENNSLASRVEFFDTRFLLYDGDYEAYEKGVDRLLHKVDSTSDPYLYNRLLDLAPETDVRDSEEYCRLNNLLEYFQGKGDEIMTASVLLDMGNLLKNVRDPKGAISLYSQADSLFRANGLEKVASWNRMNTATALFILRDTLEGVRILEEMRRDPVVRNDSDLYERVLHNLFIDGQKREALDSLYAIKGERSESLVETFMSNACLNEGRITEAVDHAEKAVAKALAEENYNDYAVALYAQADALSARGDTLKAYRSLIEAVELTDEIANANEPDAIKSNETARLLQMKRLETELAKSRWILRIVCIGFALLVLIGVGSFFIRRRIKALREKTQMESEEKERIARKLVATQIAMDETDRVLTTVGKAVEEMSGNGNRVQSREIANAIHTHKVRSTDRETFIESYSTVNPDFATRLKQQNPAITEPDVRLASYIVTGMDNKQIAATMGIRPESVKQARWRLRTKLSLPKGASLEETLRELNRSANDKA